ncbi:MAG: methylenetetrahydrofolate reductase [NAD(P)H] [Oscillospiraceae bacterium]|nr:methylenetetrahydrofolate reductase [NAD(P)H] [Oscillospiraceae bacterium]
MEKKKTAYSFEVFPPKKTSPVEVIYNTLEQLKDLNPDFISVTLGAGGNNGNLAGHTIKVAAKIKEYGIEPVVHLPCVNFSKSEVSGLLEEMKSNDITKVLALRGDKPSDGSPTKNDFTYASDLVSFIKQKYPSFNVMGACYPETHLEATSPEKDIENLKRKVDSGCSGLITQLFFDNNCFYDFLNRIRQVGINIPVEAGIMPVTNKNSIEHMITLCGASFPAKFSKVLQKFGNDKDALITAGINYAVDQITDLIANGVDGIHLYTMNNPFVAQRITDAVKGLI